MWESVKSWNISRCNRDKSLHFLVSSKRRFKLSLHYSLGGCVCRINTPRNAFSLSRCSALARLFLPSLKMIHPRKRTLRRCERWKNEIKNYSILLNLKGLILKRERRETRRICASDFCFSLSHTLDVIIIKMRQIWLLLLQSSFPCNRGKAHISKHVRKLTHLWYLSRVAIVLEKGQIT